MRKVTIFCLVLFVVVLTGCSSFSPEPTPTPEPKPTLTMLPHGILKACIYFEGELVPMGYLTFKDENGRQISYLTYVPLDGGCKDVILSPGTYWVAAKYFQDVCADLGAGCMPEDPYELEIKDGDVIVEDFHVVVH